MITSLRNPRAAAAVRLKKRAMRDRHRRFLVEGVRAVTEGLAAGAVEEVFLVGPSSADDHERRAGVEAAARGAGVPVRTVSPEVMAGLTSATTPAGVVGVARFVDVALGDLPGRGVVPVLAGVQDPGNAATIVRSAEATGAAGVVFSPPSVDPYNPKVVRASAGSLFHLPLVRHAPLAEALSLLRDRGFRVVVLAEEGESVLEADLRRPTALVVGHEVSGPPPEARDLAEATVSVPVPGRPGALPLAAAVAVALYQAVQPGAAGRWLARAVAGAAHDLRSPLTAVRGFARTLLSRWERMGEDERRRMLEAVANDAARMEVHLAHLVDAARLASGTLQLALAPVDLVELATDVGREVEGWGLARVEVSGTAAPVRADRARLRAALVAMVEAAQWWGEDGPVRVDVAGGGRPRLRVSRLGPGLPERTVVDLLRPRAPGTGGGGKVGLFVARALAEAHGGSLEVSGEGGISVVLALPREGPSGGPG
ncbi:MAG TPA: TrmH family RNA methyltransferase [Actinomycetota bacterium]|nr:TrmH family RNA methyltransferase [Actinomycetota bacterium]